MVEQFIDYLSLIPRLLARRQWVVECRGVAEKRKFTTFTLLISSRFLFTTSNYHGRTAHTSALVNHLEIS